MDMKTWVTEMLHENAMELVTTKFAKSKQINVERDSIIDILQMRTEIKKNC